MRLLGLRLADFRLAGCRLARLRFLGGAGLAHQRRLEEDRGKHGGDQ